MNLENEKKQLFLAASVGDVEKITHLLYRKALSTDWIEAKPEVNLEVNSKALLKAVECGQVEVVKALISVSVPGRTDPIALRRAAEGGHLEIVKLLIPFCDPDKVDSLALKLAASKGHLAVVKELMPTSDENGLISCALSDAAFYGHGEIIELLLPLSDQKSRFFTALSDAACRGHLECVKLLIPKCDPTHYHQALMSAVQNGRHDVVEMLMSRNSKESRSYALAEAVRIGHKEIMTTLLPLSEVKKAVKLLIDWEEFEAADRMAPFLSRKTLQYLGHITEGNHHQMINLSTLMAQKLAENLNKNIPILKSRSRPRI